MALVDAPVAHRYAEPHGEVHARRSSTRIREADYRKMLKYSAVSAVAFPFTQVLLLVFTRRPRLVRSSRPTSWPSRSWPSRPTT